MSAARNVHWAAFGNATRNTAKNTFMNARRADRVADHKARRMADHRVGLMVGQNGGSHGRPAGRHGERHRLADEESSQGKKTAAVSSGLAVGMLCDEGFDKLGDFVLLTAWELGGGLKDQLQTALGGLFLGLGRSDAEHRIGADIQCCGQFGQDLTARRFFGSLPKGDVGLGNPQQVGELLLCQPGRLPQFRQMLPVSRACALRRSSHRGPD